MSFAVTWTADTGQSGTITVTGGETSDPVELPAGTVVTLTEATPTDLPDGVVWEGYTWVPADGVTVSEDGKTATFTVQPGSTVALQLTNTVTNAPGSFTVEKLLRATRPRSTPPPTWSSPSTGPPTTPATPRHHHRHRR